jgi:hypothetical protein
VPAWAAAAAAVLLLVAPALTWRLARPGAPTDDSRVARPGTDDVSAWLSSGLVRTVGAELGRVHVPPDSKLVRLRLETDGTNYPSYRATLHLASGEEIWSQTALTAGTIDGRTAVTLTLPSELMPAGDYYVRLSGVVPSHELVERLQQLEQKSRSVAKTRQPADDQSPAQSAIRDLDRYDFRVLRR